MRSVHASTMSYRWNLDTDKSQVSDGTTSCYSVSSMLENDAVQNTSRRPFRAHAVFTYMEEINKLLSLPTFSFDIREVD